MSGSPHTYTLYVIPGSHACRAAMLMLEHKGLAYRTVNFPTGLHPVMARLRGFDAGGQTRRVRGQRTLGVRIGDSLGTVPGLAAEGERISTNHRIARFLDSRHPNPPLIPADPECRAAVEAAEAWANETLQMEARLIVLGAVRRDPEGFSDLAAAGRLGYLLYSQASVRRRMIPWIASLFAVRRDAPAQLPALLDRVDAWIAGGVLGQPELNVADFMIAPSLALILYRPDMRPMFEGRPALGLVDRLLPEPAGGEGA